METYFAKKEGRPLPTLPPKPGAPATVVAAAAAPTPVGPNFSSAAPATPPQQR